jgi:predicted transglutaminase-like cysteine proteinase
VRRAAALVPLLVASQADAQDVPPLPSPFAAASEARPAFAARGGSYSFFEQPDPSDPWTLRIGRWQLRQQAAERAGLIAPFPSRPADRLPAVAAEPAAAAKVAPGGSSLAASYGEFMNARRREIAATVLRWVQEQSKTRFVEDGPVDHWPTLPEVLAANGDDCDGLELLVYHALRQLGFPEDRVYRAILRRPRFDQHHMVTLWFEDPADPWVIDPTATITSQLRKLSELGEWVPLKVFSESREYTVTAR